MGIERGPGLHTLALLFVLKRRAGTTRTYKAGEPDTGFDNTRDTILLVDTGPAPLAISTMSVPERTSAVAALISSLPNRSLNIFTAVSSFESSVTFNRGS